MNKKKVWTKLSKLPSEVLSLNFSSYSYVMSNTQSQQEVRKESLAATGIEPDGLKEPWTFMVEFFLK